MKKVILLFGLCLLFLVGCQQDTQRQQYRAVIPESESLTSEVQEEKSNSHVPNYIYIKYRSDRVDIGDPRFEYLDTSKSSWIRGAWYDEDNEYMIINLNRTNYHYCGMPSSVWNRFKRASSFGSDYNAYIKGNFDCRYNSIPNY